ncbi:MAG: hypothetical protein HYV97_14525 [Bdellovibrio sp.]|nr:hypothetical protein [Bdellovibrio sp.]
MKKKILDFLRDEDGQTSTEYILLVAVVAMIIFKFKSIAGARLEQLTNNVFNKADGLVNE